MRKQLDISQKIQKIKLRADKHGVHVTEIEIQKITEILDRVPVAQEEKTLEDRDEKLKKIKEQISSGRYNPSANDIASSILMDEIKFVLPSDLALNKIDPDELFMASLLKAIPRGNKYFEIFHKIGSVCVSDIFKEELSSPLIEKKGSKGSERFDLMLYNGASAGFWLDMKKSHQITHVVFEFKNWRTNTHIKFGEQIGRYAKGNRAVILVTRHEPNERLIYECSKIFNKIENCLPLTVSDEKIFLAAQLKKDGSSPSSIFEEAYLCLRAA